MGAAAIHPEPPGADSYAWYIPAGILVFAGLVVIALPQPPLGLAVRAAEAQLRITWHRSARTGNLQIVDGSDVALIPVAANLASVTYQPESADVQVRLARGTAGDPFEITRCLDRPPESPAALAKDLAATEARASGLRAAIYRQKLQVQQMQSVADTLLQRTATKPKTTAPPKSPPTSATRWWRY
jgi:hypothetical protein